MRNLMASLIGAFMLVAGSSEPAKAEDKPQTEKTEVTSAKPDTSAAILGAQIFQSQCLVCHSAEKAAEKAPPMFGVKDHVLKVYPERDAFIQRVATWIKAPDAKDVLMPGAVNKFGLMPAMPQLSEQEAQAVAAFLFDTDLNEPDWYKAHYQAEHGVKP